MQTAYELLLQPAAADAAFDVERVEAALRALGATTRGDGALGWRLHEGEVTVVRVREAGTVTGLGLGVPFSDRLALLDALLGAALEVAEAQTLRLIDPQLGRAVTRADAGAVGAEFLRVSAYAGAYFGFGDARPVSAAPTDDEALSPTMKAVLVVLVFVVAMWAAYRSTAPGEPPERETSSRAPLGTTRPGKP
ncbi:MAG: hypothetical protein INH41_19265 [Myxococcaceae bacterium]|jgi:hypothetical protein|nr:hypothetical protein [Myxococcaceae bacterium]